MENSTTDKKNLQTQIEKYKQELMTAYNKGLSNDFPPRETEFGMRQVNRTPMEKMIDEAGLQFAPSTMPVPQPFTRPSFSKPVTPIAPPNIPSAPSGNDRPVTPIAPISPPAFNPGMPDRPVTPIAPISPPAFNPDRPVTPIAPPPPSTPSSPSGRPPMRPFPPVRPVPPIAPFPPFMPAPCKPCEEHPQMLPVANTLPMTREYERFQSKYPARGIIRTQAFTARKNFPVAGAIVDISKRFDNGVYTIARMVTDESGLGVDITVPALSRELSETPGISEPFLVYDITFTHPDYLPVTIENVPVFEGIISLQSVEFTNRVAAGTNESSIEYIVSEPKDL